MPKQGDNKPMNPLDNPQGTGADTGSKLKPTTDQFSFAVENMQLILPKENLKEAWEKLKKMVDIYVGSSSK